MGVKLLRSRVKLIKPRVAISMQMPDDGSGKVGKRWGSSRGGRPWRRLRAKVLHRDGYLCQPCDRAGELALAKEVDHIIPTFEGGTDDESNLQAICKACHQVKSQEEAARARARGVG